MKHGFAPDCDPDRVMAATEIGLQALLMATQGVAGPTEYRVSRDIETPPSLSTYERRDLARLAHAGVFSDGFVRHLYFDDDEFRTVQRLDHPSLREAGLSCVDADDPHTTMRNRIDRLSSELGIDEHDLRLFYMRLGIHPYGAEHMLRDNDAVASIRDQLYGAYPCELHTRGAVFGDFAVDFDRPNKHYRDSKN